MTVCGWNEQEMDELSKMINIKSKCHLLLQLVGLYKSLVTPGMVTLVVADVFVLGLDVVAEGADASQNLTTFITWVISQINLECVRST